MQGPKNNYWFINSIANVYIYNDKRLIAEY